MIFQEIINDINEYCVANQNEAIVRKYSRYFKDGYDAYGLTLDLIETKIESLIIANNINLTMAIEISKLLVPLKKYEFTSFAILLLKRFKKEFSKSTFSEIANWFDLGINNWGHTDVICSELLAPLLEKKIIIYTEFSSWLTASNKFKRRAVSVSLIKMLKYTNDYQPFYNFIEPLMIDPDREVQQGVGWFLREAWKKQPETTEIFLVKWKDLSPRIIMQYATEKMSSEQKLHFKKNRKHN